MKNKILIFLITILFLVGLLFVLYPTISDLWNNMMQSRIIAKNIDNIEQLDDKDYSLILEEAKIYNNYISKNNFLKMTKDELTRYNSMLNISDDGMMGYIEIPKINVRLPIYHGTGDDVLQVAIGHMEGSSLPIGGESTHTVLLGHRGLPSAKLFTSLDKMTEGDIFYIYVLKETIAYKVDNISIVEPYELDDLKVVEGEDYATLVTCTPYGVNTHRLLVRGTRTEIEKNENTNVSLTKSNKILPIIVIIIIILALIIIIKRVKYKKYKKRRKCKH